VEDEEEAADDWLDNDDDDGAQSDSLEEARRIPKLRVETLLIFMTILIILQVPISSKELFEEKFKDVGEEWQQLSTLKIVFDKYGVDGVASHSVRCLMPRCCCL
jgi:hypothetical protein